MGENTEQNDAVGVRCGAASTPVTVGVYTRSVGGNVRGDTGISLDDWLAKEVRRAQASPVVYAIVHWGYLSQGFEIERRSPNATQGLLLTRNTMLESETVQQTTRLRFFKYSLRRLLCSVRCLRHLERIFPNCCFRALRRSNVTQCVLYVVDN
jgi:hypothetical protein